ncbi:uncharacterized protein [Cicer arietinum]|uniref:uncharacterized protein n=1 Tax=Cicer arietinum TaxID=3827 RepID=UPI003CC67B83
MRGGLCDGRIFLREELVLKRNGLIKMFKIIRNGSNTLFWKDPRLVGGVLREKFSRLFHLSLQQEKNVVVMLEMLRREDIQGRRWRRQLFALEEELVEQCRILLVNVHLQVNVSDKWSWNNTQGVSYSINEAYFVLRKEFVVSINTPPFQDLVWHPFVQAKVSLIS